MHAYDIEQEWPGKMLGIWHEVISYFRSSTVNAISIQCLWVNKKTLGGDKGQRVYLRR